MKRVLLLSMAVLGALAVGCSSTDATSTTDTTAAVAATSPSKATTSTKDSSDGRVDGPSTASTKAPSPTTGDGKTFSTLDTTACVDITSAMLDILVATTEEQASAAVAVLLKYKPPSDVQAAARHFIITKGGQVTDPDFSVNNATLKSWVSAVCP